MNILLSLFLVILITHTVSMPPYQNNINYDFQSFLTPQEQQILPLSKFFMGYNLSYDIINQQGPQIETVVQPLNTIANSNYPDQLIAATIVTNNNNQASLTGLFLSAFGTNNYSIYQSLVTPSDKINMQAYYSLGTTGFNIKCYGLLQISNSILAADCMNATDSLNVNVFYLFNSSDQTTAPNPQKGSSLLYQINQRVSLLYQTSEPITYVLSYTPFNQYSEQNVENFIEVYIYSNQPNNNNLNNNPFGNLQSQTVIDGGLLNISNLQIVSLQVLGDTIYLLDQIQGLFTFSYLNNKIINLQNYTKFLQDQIGNQKMWGMNIQNVEQSNILLISSDNIIFEFNWPNLQGNPTIIQSYYGQFIQQLNTQGNLIAVFNINLDFITVQFGNSLTVFRRGTYYPFAATVSQYSNLMFCNNLISLLNNAAYNIIINNPSIIINSGQQVALLKDGSSTNFTIRATSYNLSQLVQTCQQNVLIQYEQDPNFIGVLGQAPKSININGQISNINFEIPVGQFQQGPNLNYNVTIVDNDLYGNLLLQITPNIPSPTTIKYNNNNNELSIIETTSNIQFSRMQFFGNEGYIQVQQNSNNNQPIMLLCHTSSDIIAQCDCSLMNTMQLNNQIAGFVQGQDLLIGPYYLAIYQNEIDVFNITGFNIQNISFSTDDVQKIIYVANNQYFIFVLQLMKDNTFLIEVFNQQNKQFVNYLNILPINLGSLVYSPYMIVTSNQLSNILVIRSIDSFVTISINNRDIQVLSITQLFPPIGYISSITYISNDILITVFDGDNGYIQEYSLINLNKIIPTKNYSLYGWKIENLRTVSNFNYFSQVTQKLYLVMSNQGKLAIFNFQAGEQVINVLSNVINLPNDLQLTSQIQNFDVAGQDNFDIINIYYQSNIKNSQQNILYYVPKDQSLFINLTYSNTRVYFIQDAQISLQTFGWNDNKNPQQQIVYDMQLVRSIEYVSINHTAINSQLSYLQQQLNISENQTLPYSITFNDDNWFIGQYPEYQLTIANFTFIPKITLQNHVNIENKIQINQTIVNDIFIDHLTQNIFILTDYELLCYDKNQNQIFNLNTKQSTYQLQYQLLPQYDYTGQNPILRNISIIFVNMFYIQIMNIDLSQLSSPLQIYPIIVIKDIYSQQFGQAYYIDNLLLILQVMIIDQNILIYNINQGQDTPILVNMINQSTFGLNPQQNVIQFTSFDIWKINDDYRKLILSQNTQGFFLATIQASDYTNIQDAQFFNLAQYLTQASVGLAFPDSINIVRIIVASSTQPDTNPIIMRLLIFTDMLGIFDINIFFDNNSQTYFQFQPEKTQIIQMYAPYGLISPGIKVSIYGQNRITTQYNFNLNLFAVRYYDDKSYIITMAIYNTSKTPEPGSASQSSNIPFINMFGGQQFEYSNDFNSFGFAFQYNLSQVTGSQVTLYCTNPQASSFFQMNIYNNLKLIVTSNSWNNDIITLVPQGEYLNYQTQNVTLQTEIHRYIKPHQPSQDNGLSWYWILLIVLASILFALLTGILIWRYCRRKRNSYVDLEYQEQTYQKVQDTYGMN